MFFTHKKPKGWQRTRRLAEVEQMKADAFWSLIKHFPRLRWLWMSETTAAFGDYFFTVALMWYVFIRTGSGLALGLVGVVSFVPAVALGPWLGALGDRLNRKTLMMVSNLASGALAGSLALVLIGGYGAIWPVYAATFLMAVASSLYNPARAGFIPEIVSQDHLVEAQALLSTSRQIARVTGSSLGGLTIALVGAPRTMAFDFFALLLAALFLMRIVYRSKTQGSSTAPDTRHSIRDAWQWLRKQPAVLVLSVVGMVSNIALGPVNILPAMLIHSSFHASAAALGRFDAAIGVGMIAGGLIIGMMVLPRVGLLFIMALTSQGLGMFLVALSTTANMANVGNLVLGLGLIAANAPSQAMMQTIIPPDRISGIFGLVGAINAMAIPITYGGVGAVGSLIGPQRTYGLAAVLMALCALTAIATPGIRHFRKHPREETDVFPSEDTIL